MTQPTIYGRCRKSLFSGMAVIVMVNKNAKNNTVKREDAGNPYAYTVLQNLKDAGCTDEKRNS